MVWYLPSTSIQCSGLIMQKNDINSLIVYRSQIEDSQLRTITINTSACNIKFYRSYKLTDFDKLICSILLKQNGNTVKLLDLGYILGFDLKYAPQQGSYKDDAEIALIQRFLYDLKAWGLIQIYGLPIPEKSDIYAVPSEKINWEEATVVLTHLGRTSAITGKKYAFFEGKVDKLFFLSLTDDEGNKVKNFPFFNELGVEAKLYGVNQLAYDDDFAAIIDSFDSNDLIEDLKCQCDKDITIFSASDSGYLGISKTSVNVELYQYEGDYKLRFLHDSQECSILNMLYELEANHREKEKKIEWALYYKLLHDKNAVLNYSTLHIFEDIIEFNEIIKDSRLDWHDNLLLPFIIEHCDADGWRLLSECCSTDILEDICSEYQESLDWGNLTLRLTEEFLIANSSVYPWEKELLTARNNASTKLIQHFLLESFSRGNNEDEWFKWDWTDVYPFLERSFIKENLEEIPFDLSLFVKEIDSDDYDLISRYPNAAWPWDYILANFPISFLLKEFNLCWKYCHKPSLLERLFFDNTEVQTQSLSSIKVKSIIESTPETEKASLCLNSKTCNWNHELINYFECVGLINWESVGYKKGFDVNTSIDWSAQFFTTYNRKIKTTQGSSHVSGKISDLTLVDNYPGFNWDWSVLSKREDVYNNPQFVLAHNECINRLDVALLCDLSLLESYFAPLGLNEYMSCNTTVKQRLTQGMSIDFIRRNINLPWDWSLLTRRVYSFMKLDVIGHSTWIELWDWSFLSQNIEIDKIFEYAISYSDKWCWSIIIERLSSEFLMEDSHLQILANSIVSHPLSETLWTKITELFDSKVILDFVNTPDNPEYHWDLGVVYNRADFDLRKHIEESESNIDWGKLSSSTSLNTLFAKLKKGTTRSLWFRELSQLLTNPNTHWDYSKVTRLSNVIDSPLIFAIEIDWDWDYISENAKWINISKETGSIFYFTQYQSKLSFKILSKRTDIGLTESIVNKYDSIVEWDWNALIVNPAINFSFQFIEKHCNLDWDWKMLSSREDLTNEILEALIEKEWDWFVITGQKFFKPTLKILDLITAKTDNLDWKQLSINSHLSKDIVETYWNYLDISAIISEHNKFQDLLPIELVKAHCINFPWNVYNLAIGNSISLEMVEAFEDYIDWSNVSNSQLIPWSETLIKRYEGKLYWSLLNNNPKVHECVPNFVTAFAKRLNIVRFIDRIKCTVEKPCIYHFTHFYNAIDVIKSRKILSRDRALELGLLRYDSAGAVIGRSSKAHPYARFYFRPGTPTQYYNEALGADSKLGEWRTRWYKNWDGEWESVPEWKSKYPKAVGLGLPKCPIPVFFKFDIEEVLAKIPNNCFYSDRNMQADNPNVYQIINNPDSLGVEYLYSTMQDAYITAKRSGRYDRLIHQNEMNKVMKYSQQEFLVMSEFDFSEIKSLQIICYDKSYTDILKQIFADDPISEKIVSYEHDTIFDRENRSIALSSFEDKVGLSTNFKDEYYFIISGEKLSEVEFDLSKCNVINDASNELRIIGDIEWKKTNIPFNIIFVDPKARTKEWLVYQNI